jgi:hypothetical protein
MLTAAATAAASVLPQRSARALTFNFIPDPGTPPHVVAAFAAAGDLWSAIFSDDVTVNIRIAYVDFSDDPTLPDNALGGAGFDTDDDGLIDAFTYLAGPSSGGAAGAGYLAIVVALTQDATSPADTSKLAMLQPGPDYVRVVNLTSNNPNGSGSDVPYLDDANYNDGVWATRANLKALGLVDPNDPALDGFIRFNSLVSNWDFQRADGIGATSRDFVATAAHEIAHVLGFKSEIDIVENLVLSDDWLAASMMDLFRFADDFGPNVPDITIDAAPEYFPLSLGQRAALCNSLTIPGGCQASHWADNIGLGLMDPTSDIGRVNPITSNDIELLDVIGWTLRPAPRPPTDLRALRP